MPGKRRLAGIVTRAWGHRHTARRWVGTGAWAIADQGMFAISNFGINVLLARWLAPAEYGAFGVAYSVFLFVGTVHTAIFSEPLLVFGPNKYNNRLQDYLRLLLRWQWLSGSAFGALLVLIGAALWYLGYASIAPTLVAVALSCPAILFQWLMRRACYVNLRPRLAATGGAIYMALAGGLVIGAYKLSILGPATALASMAIGSLATGLWLGARLGVNLGIQRSRAFRLMVLTDHWRYGRWEVGASALTWIPGNLFYLVLPILDGLGSVGTLRALMNVIMPAMQTNVALSVVILPAMARASRGPRSYFTRIVGLTTALFMGGALLYGLLAAIFSRPVLGMLYGPQYGAFAPILWVLAVLPVMAGWKAALSGALRALRRPDALFYANVAASLATATIGLLCVTVWHLVGAGFGFVLSAFVGALVLSFRFVPAMDAATRVSSMSGGS